MHQVWFPLESWEKAIPRSGWSWWCRHDCTPLSIYQGTHYLQKRGENMFYICLYHLTSAEDTFENLFWLHRYANDLLSPLFMPAGTPIPLILYVSFIYRHIKKHITFSMGEGIASVWRLYWRRISNIYFYLSAFQQNTNCIWVKL